MSKKQRRICQSAVLIILISGCATVQEHDPEPTAPPPKAKAPHEFMSKSYSNPAEAQFSYVDVENFVTAYQAIQNGMDTTLALQSLYLDKASLGLEQFIEKYDLTEERLREAVQKRPEVYGRIPSTLAAIKKHQDSYHDIYAEIKRIIPDAVFPTTYFVVEGYRGIGSGSAAGPLLSIEKRSPESIPDDLLGTLVHEMIHMEQYAAIGQAYFAIFSGPERTLLATSIREGGATYMAQIIAGGSRHKNKALEYYLAHEQELWTQFSAEMMGNEMGDWLWATPANPDWPRDLGYVIGARIVGHYYETAENKEAAATQIMNITDYKGFLDLSGYAKQFKSLSKLD